MLVFLINSPCAVFEFFNSFIASQLLGKQCHAGNLKHEAGSNRGGNKELVSFLLLEFQENGDMIQSCAE